MTANRLAHLAEARERERLSRLRRRDYIKRYNAEYNKRNSARLVAHNAQWRKDHPEENSAMRKRHYAENQERLRQYAKDWYAANKERKHIASIEYRERNGDALRQRDREKYALDPEKHVRQSLEWSKRNPQKRRVIDQRRRAMLANAPGSFTAADLAEQYRKQAGLCFYCHKQLINHGNIDHVIPISKGGSNFPENLVLACRPCNSRKHDMMPDEFLKILKAR